MSEYDGLSQRRTEALVRSIGQVQEEVAVDILNQKFGRKKMFSFKKAKQFKCEYKDKETQKNMELVKKLLGEKENLIDQIDNLKREKKDLTHERKLADEDIKHMVKIKEEKMEVANEKDRMKERAEMRKEVEEMRSKFADKSEKFLQDQAVAVKEMYGQILKRLPDINYAIKQTIGVQQDDKSE